MIFRNTRASFDPRRRVGWQFEEIAMNHGLIWHAARARVAEMLRAVDVPTLTVSRKAIPTKSWEDAVGASRSRAR